MKDDLTHSRTCGVWDLDVGCTCCLAEIKRIAELESALGTEQTMHAAWRKRAEEAELKLASYERADRDMSEALNIGNGTYKP